jgi:regulator of cell morphogenesis and NO signaling
MINIPEQTLAAIVTNDHAAVAVFERYDLDFCCKGKRSLAEACMEKGIPLDKITAELEQLQAPSSTKRMPFSEMNAGQLVSYILVHHHFYVKQAMPTILTHLQKVASKHGDRFPYMKKVFELFTIVSEEMTLHMQKEEHILFPRIKEVGFQFEKQDHISVPEGFISAPVKVMEMEHEHAGELLYEIRTLTSNYTAPPDACTTFQVSLAELKEFEEDLHEHVHLENNLLFPMAEKMQASLLPGSHKFVKDLQG